MKGEKTPLLTHEDELDGANIVRKKTKYEEFKEAYFKKEVFLLLFYVVAYISFGVINSLFLKKVMNSFQNYAFFLGQVTNYGYIPIFGTVVLVEIFFTSLISKEQRAFPWWKFAIMGTLDAINGYFVIIGGVRTSGPMQQLLNQAIIPVTIVSTYLFLKEKYTLFQIGGAGVIVGGVAIALYPSLTGKNNTGNVLFWNVFYLAQALPFAASNIYKDVAFKEVDMDVWYLQFWDVFWQSLAGTLLFPINVILPPPANIEWKQIIPFMENGGQCMIGQDVITPINSNCTAVIHNATDVVCDNCNNAWLILLVYVMVNVVYNVFILLVIKHGSATIFSIASTVRLPLANLCFSFEFIMGKDSVPFSGFSLYGLIVILSGLVIYRIASARKANAEKTRVIPHLGPGGGSEAMEVVHQPSILPKTNTALRQQYLSRLGIGVHSSSPTLRSPPSYRPPPTSPQRFRPDASLSDLSSPASMANSINN